MSKKIGIIAEDESDVDTLKELIARITGKSNLSYKRFVGRGCGKIKRKCSDWAKQLQLRGCNVLILIHDLDSNNIQDLKLLLEKNIKPNPIRHSYICIPIQEMEAWILADPASIKKSFNLKKSPKITGNPETIDSPKETLGRLIRTFSDNSKVYINTKHNTVLAKNLNLNTVKTKCKSFSGLYEFVSANI